MKIDRHVFDWFPKFRNLGTLLDSMGGIIEEIKPRIAAGNRPYCSLNYIPRSRADNSGVGIQT